MSHYASPSPERSRVTTASADLRTRRRDDKWRTGDAEWRTRSQRWRPLNCRGFTVAFVKAVFEFKWLQRADDCDDAHQALQDAQVLVMTPLRRLNDALYSRACTYNGTNYTSAGTARSNGAFSHRKAAALPPRLWAGPL